MEAEIFPKEVILELVKTSFEQISAAQWALLVAGTPDSETKAIIADTIGDVIQRISSDVVRHLLPAINDHLRGQESQTPVRLGGKEGLGICSRVGIEKKKKKSIGRFFAK